MRALAFKKGARALIMFAVAVTVTMAGLVLTGSSASAAAVSINLCAVPGTATLPGSVSVPIWGFGVPATPGDCTAATASLPGPQLVVNEGDIVTVNVTNALPGTRTLSFDIPGVSFNAGPATADAGSSVSRTFTASAPGVYLYRSGGDAGRQQAMGLFGALIVRSGTVGQAYDNPATGYDVEAVLVLSTIDPGFNAAPDTSDIHRYVATYWLINGKAYPDTAPGIAATAGQRVLLR